VFNITGIVEEIRVSKEDFERLEEGLSAKRAPGQRVMILHGFSSQEVERLIQLMRAGAFPQCILGVTTPISLGWNLRDLISKLEEEHHFIMQRRAAEEKKRAEEEGRLDEN
jgi:hypothetical protein